MLSLFKYVLYILLMYFRCLYPPSTLDPTLFLIVLEHPQPFFPTSLLHSLCGLFLCRLQFFSHIAMDKRAKASLDITVADLQGALKAHSTVLSNFAKDCKARNQTWKSSPRVARVPRDGQEA